jgi:recombination protein RecA
MPRKKGTTTDKAPARKAPTKKKAKVSALAQARSVLSKSLGKEDQSLVELDMDQLKKPLPHLPTGSLIIDWLIGGQPNKFGVSPCPGAPCGKIWQVYGHESSGKTTLCKMAAATTCQNGGTVGFLDYEYAFDPSYAASLGVPIADKDKFELRQPTTLEAGFKIIHAWANAGVDLIIIDSCGAGVPKVIFTRKVEEIGEEQRMGLVASRWSQYLPKFNGLIMRTGTAVMATAQVRAGNFGGMGSNTTVQGGNTWKFFASIRMKLQRIQTEKASGFDVLTHATDKVAFGIKVKAKLDKCKVSANAHHEAVFHIRHGEGVDDLQSCIDIALAHGHIKKSGSWVSWHRPSGSDIRAQGMEKFRKSIQGTDGAFQDLYRQVVTLLTTKGAELSMEEEEAIYEDPNLAELEDIMGEIDNIADGVALADPDAPPPDEVVVDE